MAIYQYNVVDIAARGGGDRSDDLNRDGRQGDKSEGSDRGDEGKVLEEGRVHRYQTMGMVTIELLTVMCSRFIDSRI